MSRKNVKLISTIIAIILALIMFGSLFTSIFMYAGASLQSELDGLQQELAQIEAEKAQIQAELKVLDEEIDDAYAVKDAIDKNVSAISSEIDVTDELINSLELSIEVKTEELADAQVRLDDQYELLKQRVRLMYERGETTYLDILLDSGSFSELLIRAEGINQIVEADKQILQDFTETKDEIAETKVNLEEDKSEQEYLKENLVESKIELEREQARSEAIIDDLEATEFKGQTMLSEFEQIEADAEAEIANLARQIAAQSTGDYTGGQFTWPTPGYTRVTSPFGYRTHPVTGVKNKFHTGTDVGAPSGVAIVALSGGTVVRSTYSSGYGNNIMIDHGGGYTSLYGHMTSRAVEVGDVVEKGEKIGTVGSTGMSTGPHLHFEIHKNGEYTDPMSYFN